MHNSFLIAPKLSTTEVTPKKQHADSSYFENKAKEAFTHAANLIIGGTADDPGREGLTRTPERFAKAFEFLSSGYLKTAKDAVGEGIFAAEGEGLIAVRDVEFYSLCEHHILPFWGKVSVAYYPGDKILGLSKIPRLVDLHARRLQVQERLTESIARDIEDLLAPGAVVVRVEAQHLCMMMRGVEKQNSATMTETIRNPAKLGGCKLERLLSAVSR